jgi:uncharacterized protein (TIGR02266 family)
MGLVRNKILGIEDREKERTPICVLVEEPGKEQDFFDKTLDLSEDGIFVVTENPKPKGQEITLRFALPGSTPFTVGGKVARVTKKGKLFGVKTHSGMGIRFTSIDSQCRKLIKQFVGT